MTPLIQIAPRFPPEIDGVGEYALLLARQLKATANIESNLLAGDPNWPEVSQMETFACRKATARSADVLCETMESIPADLALLHYVGYGFHPFGIPNWLVHGVERWLKPGRKLLVFFHELWSKGPPWSNVFWLSWRQRQLARRLHKLAVHSFTSTIRMHALLNFQTTVLPIPSTVLGHTDRLLNIPDRPAPWTPIVFGQPSTRLRTVQRHRQLLTALQAQGLLKQVIIMGSGSAQPPDASAEVKLLSQYLPTDKITVVGQCDPLKVKQHFTNASFHLSYYPAQLACKSSTLMTALACGCPVVLLDDQNAAPLSAGHEFLACDGSQEAIQRFIQQAYGGILSRVGQAGHDWYCEHASWPIIGARIAERVSSHATH